MFARDDKQGINDLYWQTAVWTAVFSFPIFALTCSLAEPITVFSFGAKYHDAWLVLALLSLGHYVNAAGGFNGLTLKVCGKLRYIVAVNLATAALHFTLALLLIPRYGALGAAIGTCTALIVHKFLKQYGLRGTGVQPVNWHYLRAYVAIAVAAVALGAVQLLVQPPVVVGLALAALASLAVLRVSRDLLGADQMFPELRKLPLAGLLLGRGKTHA
jgi:O-antigen/teichoic acid export membrane protein